MERVPYLGSGVGLRREHFEALPEAIRPLDWIEVTPENHMRFGGRARRALHRCRDRWPLVPHGVSLDLGGLDPLDRDYLTDLRRLCSEFDAPFFTDHLCFNRIDGVYLHDLLPLPFSDDAVAHVVPRVLEAQERVGRPLLLENATYYAVMPGQTMDEATFLTRVLEEADCGLLLDVNNVYVNSRNHGHDPIAFIDALPLERVGQVHLAGHHAHGALIVDTHGAAVPEPVWALYEHLLRRTGPVSTLVEWDQDVPGVDELLAQADRARLLLRQAEAARASSKGAGVRP